LKRSDRWLMVLEVDLVLGLGWLLVRAASSWRMWPMPEASFARVPSSAAKWVQL
jgi:hypothetical protein